MKLSLIRCPLALYQHLRLGGKMALTLVALNETQPDTLPARFVTAFTPGWEDGINFLSQCQLERGFTSNCAELCS